MGARSSVRGRMSSVVQELRRTRRVRRLGDLEWFEVAYRVYLVALVGGGVVLWLSGLVGDEPATPAQVADVLERGPAVLGLGVAIAVALGLRSGSDGGPVSVEAADVRHLLLAPVPRRAVLARPVVAAAARRGVRRGDRRRHRRRAGRPAAARHRRGVGSRAAPPPGRPPAPRSSPSPCSPTSAGCPRWAATGLAAARPRRPGRRGRRVVAGAGRHDRQPRPVGHAPGARRPRRRRRRRRPRSALAVAVAGRLRDRAARAPGGSRVAAALRRDDAGPAHRRPAAPPAPRRARPHPAVGARSDAAGGAIEPCGGAAGAGCCATRSPGWCAWRCSPSPPAPPPSPCCAARRRRSSASASPCTCSALDAVEPLSQEIDHPDRTDGVPDGRGLAAGPPRSPPRPSRWSRSPLIGAATVAALEPDAGRVRRSPCACRSRWPARAAPSSASCATPPTRCRRRSPRRPPCRPSSPASRRRCGCCGHWPSARSPGSACSRRASSRRAGRPCAIAVAAALVVAATVLWVRRRDEWRARIRAFLAEGRAAAGMTAACAPHRHRQVVRRRAGRRAARPQRRPPASGSCCSGHNGSGKTTLLRIAAGLLEPTAGTVSVAGQPAGSLAARAATSYLGDQPVFYDDLSVREHLEYVARLHGATEWEQRARPSCSPPLGLADRADDLPATFSRGHAPEGGHRPGVHPPVRAAARRRAVRRARSHRSRGAARVCSPSAHAGGAALVVATHELLTVAGSQRVVALRDGAARVRRTARRRRHRRARSPLKRSSRGVTVPLMYEFDSVSVSSYEASSLAAKLTEKSGDGWEVVAIVPAGSDITAFLKRESTSATTRRDDGRDDDGRRRRRAGRQRTRRVGHGAAPPTGTEAVRVGRDRRRRPPPPTAAAGRSTAQAASTPPPQHPPPPRPRPRRSRPGGTPTRPAATSCATGTGRPGPSTSRAPASSTPTRPSPDRSEYVRAGLPGSTTLGRHHVLGLGPPVGSGGDDACDVDRSRRHPRRVGPRVDPLRPVVRARLPRRLVPVPAQRPARRRPAGAHRGRRPPLRLPPPRRPLGRAVAARPPPPRHPRPAPRLPDPRARAQDARPRLHQPHPHRRSARSSTSAA